MVFVESKKSNSSAALFYFSLPWYYNKSFYLRSFVYFQSLMLLVQSFVFYFGSFIFACDSIIFCSQLCFLFRQLYFCMRQYYFFIIVLYFLIIVLLSGVARDSCNSPFCPTMFYPIELEKVLLYSINIDSQQKEQFFKTIKELQIFLTLIKLNGLLKSCVDTSSRSIQKGSSKFARCEKKMSFRFCHAFEAWETCGT